jgi:hypothetical protein
VKALPLFGPMTATSPDVVFFLGSVNRSVLFPLCGLSSLGENLDLLVRRRWRQWCRAPPWRRCFGRLCSVSLGGQHRDNEGGGLVEDSSLRRQWRRKVVRRRALAWRLKGLTSAGSGP